MTDFRIRTEDLRDDEILSNVREDSARREYCYPLLRNANPVIEQGSRGTGKSFCLKSLGANCCRSLFRVGFCSLRVLRSELTHQHR